MFCKLSMGNSKAISDELNCTIEKRISDLNRKLQKAFGVKLDKVKIDYDLRGKCAGQALLGKNTMRLNRVLLQENTEHFIFQTVGHEFAHLACFKLFAERGHGEKWQFVMRALGLEPERCHRYPTGNARVRSLSRFSYRCECRMHVLTSIRHNRISRGSADYLCRYCHTKLVIDSQLRVF